MKDLEDRENSQETAIFESLMRVSALERLLVEKKVITAEELILSLKESYNLFFEEFKKKISENFGEDVANKVEESFKSSINENSGTI